MKIRVWGMPLIAVLALIALAGTGVSVPAGAAPARQVLRLNPGSAGPRRFGRPRTVARIEIREADSESGGAPSVTAEVLSAEE